MAGRPACPAQAFICITPRAAGVARPRLSFNLIVQLTAHLGVFPGAICSRVALSILSTVLRSPLSPPLPCARSQPPLCPGSGRSTSASLHLVVLYLLSYDDKLSHIRNTPGFSRPSTRPSSDVSMRTAVE